jgi:hypothetical protein
MCTSGKIAFSHLNSLGMWKETENGREGEKERERKRQTGRQRARAFVSNNLNIHVGE